MSTTDIITTATVIAFNKKSEWATLEHADHPRGLELCCPCFFGGVFAPYPTVGQALQVKINDLGEVIDAWHPTKK